MWEVWYGLEASNYLADNGSLVAGLFFAMESLAEQEGFPQDSNYQQIDEMTFWQVLDHLVIYERKEQEKVVQIHVIRPS